MITSNFSGLKIDKFEVTLDRTSDVNTYQTDITWEYYCSVSISSRNWNMILLPDPNGITSWNLNKAGLFTVNKANAQHGGENKLYVTVIHD